jgi:tetratricopeptide (TPR) repeat protein
MPAEQTDTHAPEMPEREEQFVPAWLAALVLVLLLGVMGLGGYVVRGVVSGESRQLDRAEEQIERWRDAVDENPDSIEARVQLGYAYQQDGRFDRAVGEYEFVIEREPGNTAALYNLGLVYQATGVDDRAERMFWKVLEVEPDHVLAARALGEMYAERKQYRSLLRAVRPVVRAHPEIADLQYLTGLGYENTGHPDWAAARYRLALKYSPGYKKAVEGLDRLGEVIR